MPPIITQNGSKNGFAGSNTVRIVDVEQEQAVLRIEQDQPRRRTFDHLALRSRAASTAP